MSEVHQVRQLYLVGLIGLVGLMFFLAAQMHLDSTWFDLALQLTGACFFLLWFMVVRKNPLWGLPREDRKAITKKYKLGYLFALVPIIGGVFVGLFGKHFFGFDLRRSFYFGTIGFVFVIGAVTVFYTSRLSKE